MKDLLFVAAIGLLMYMMPSTIRAGFVFLIMVAFVIALCVEAIRSLRMPRSWRP
jgi:hypothetical protein